MAANKSIGKNFIYNLLYELFQLLVPLLVTPYVSRVLGEEASGQYSYIYSIVTFFTLFAALGFGRYAQRLIAQHQGDAHQQTVDFWDIVLARLIPVVCVLAVYLILWIKNIYGPKYRVLVGIFSINIVAIALDIAFFFQGNEEFGKIVFRNIAVKAVGFLCIFAFVRSPGDLWIYTLIQCGIIFVSNALLWVYMPGYLLPIRRAELHPLKHLPATIMLFLPTIATSVYTSLDKTLIGLITRSDAENGNYEYAERLVKMGLTVISSLGSVMIPRNSQRFADGRINEVEENIYRSSRFVMLVGVPMMLGFIVVSDNLIPWYLGPGYSKAANLIKLLSPIIVIIGFSNVFGMQYLIPCGKDKQFTAVICFGAATNFVLNLFLIRIWASYGAAIATVIAESAVTVVMYCFVRKNISAFRILKESWRYWLSGTVMFVVCYFVAMNLDASVLNTFLITGVGAVVYVSGVLILNDGFVFSVAGRMLELMKRKNRSI
ncbi:MAG: flippase [Clostridiales bacterium]|nr:flippase [Clostridiales bacterium]